MDSTDSNSFQNLRRTSFCEVDYIEIQNTHSCQTNKTNKTINENAYFICS